MENEPIVHPSIYQLMAQVGTYRDIRAYLRRFGCTRAEQSSIIRQYKKSQYYVRIRTAPGDKNTNRSFDGSMQDVGRRVDRATVSNSVMAADPREEEAVHT